MSLVIGYTRVSTGEQADSGLSLEDQEQRIRSYCALYDLELVRIETDAGKSAKTLRRREALARAREAARTNVVAGIVFSKIDRLTRNLMDFNSIIQESLKCGYALHSVAEKMDTSSATGRMICNMIANIAQWEREQNGERVKAALAQLPKGTKVGRPPLGWEYSAELDANGRRKIVPVPAEQETIKIALAYHLEGLSLAKIGAKLEAEGRLTKTGRAAWSVDSVRGALQAVGG